jgi:predicted regulator of Ras-like GTPase activity (Roadblock/LC7/MglB family)
VSSFARILHALVERVPGALGAIFADWEGEAVDHFAHMPPIDIQLVGAHWGIVLMQASDRLARAGVGRVEELLVECSASLVLIRRVTERYYVVLTTKRSVHLGTARRELERSAQTLLGEM